MVQESKMQDMQEKYKKLSQAYKRLEKQFQQLNQDYEKRAQDYEILDDDCHLQEERLDDLSKQINMQERSLDERNAELQLVKKAIEMAKLQQLSEEQRAEADQQYLAAIDKYLYGDTFTMEFLKSLGKKRYRDKNGDIKEKDVYVSYIERRENRRNRAMADQQKLRRPLPSAGGSDDGGDSTKFRQQEGEEELSF